MAPSERELSAVRLTEGAHGRLNQCFCTEQRRLPDCPATLVHSADCVKVLWCLLQAPSDPACAGPPPSLREAFGQAVTQVPHFPARASSPRSRLVMMAVRPRAERAN